MFAARDRSCIFRVASTLNAKLSTCSHGRDVVIKVVRKGAQGRSEYEILRLLNSAPLRDHPGNSTVAVLEFIEYEDWYFAVMPFCDGCDEVPFCNAAEVMDFAEQVLSVSSCIIFIQLRSAQLIVTIYDRDYVSCTIITLHIWYDLYIQFGHPILIIAKDVSHENILMNHHGTIPDYDLPSGGDELRDFRSAFPVQYLLVDFGFASYSHLGPNSGLLVDPLPTGRPHRAPESV